MTKQKTWLLVTIAALLALPGCRMFRGWSDDEPDTWSGDYGTSSYGLTWTNVEGELGGRDFALNDVSGAAYGDSFEIDHLEGANWTMFRLSLLNQAIDELPANTVLSSYNGDVELLGCVGPRPGDYDYDGYATDVTVTVSQGDTAQLRNVEFVATFQDDYGEQSVQGSFQLDLTVDDGVTGATVPD